MMMMKTNLITPPPELVKKIFGDALRGSDGQHDYELRLIHAAYASGADQELEACCLLVDDGEHAASYGCHNGPSLRIARRPKPPSLRKQAYDALDTYIYGEPDPKDKERTYNTIRRALEALDD
jgi:hypothetical protein